MRARPTIQTFLRPSVVVPGGSLHVEVVLTSTSETPVDFIELGFRGTEQIQVGKYGESRVLHSSAKRYEPPLSKLSVGEHRVDAKFDMPPGLAPSYNGRCAWIRYELYVHVSIPWWPDLRVHYKVPVASAPSSLVPTPAIFVSSLDGARGAKPYIEASFDSTTLDLGGAFAGAISVANPGRATIRGVNLNLIAYETLKGNTAFPHVTEARRVCWRIHEGAPPDSVAIPFRATLPRDMPMPITGQLFTMSSFLEVVVDVAWGFNANLRAPVTIVPAGAETPALRAHDLGPPGRGRVAQVGRERTAAIWAEVATRRGLLTDGDQMSAQFGAVRLLVQIEERGTDGDYTRAMLHWAPLGIDLHVARRTWTDVVTRSIPIDGDARDLFTVRAREAEQVRALLGAYALSALAGFGEVHVDDVGARCVSQGGAEAGERLDAFVTQAIVAAEAFAQGIEHLPPPRRFEAAADAWRAFAQRLGGRLERGSMAIRTASYAGESVEIATVWAHGTLNAQPDGTAVRVLLSPPAESPLDLESPSTSEETRAIARALQSEVQGVHFECGVLEARVPGAVDDPSTLERVLDELTRLARSARGRPAAGPFR